MSAEVVKQLVGVLGPLLVCLSLELCGSGKKLGFKIGFVVQACNFTIGVLFGIWGFIYGSGITAVFFYRQYLRWKKSRVTVTRRESVSAGNTPSVD